VLELEGHVQIRSSTVNGLVRAVIRVVGHSRRLLLLTEACE
jgi:hypothetical protein